MKRRGIIVSMRNYSVYFFIDGFLEIYKYPFIFV
jgi:hypothetical protein